MSCVSLWVCLLLVALSSPLAAAEGDPVLERDTLPAAGRQSTLLTIGRFGRYAILAKSATGTALQIVDRMAGPGETAGSAGEQDGRLDVFLERGEYRMLLEGHPRAKGEARLVVRAFCRAIPAPALEARGDEGRLHDPRRLRAALVLARGEGTTARVAGGRRPQPRRPAHLARRTVAGRRRPRDRTGATQGGPAPARLPAGHRAGSGDLPGHRVRWPRATLGRGERGPPAPPALRSPAAPRGGPAADDRGPLRHRPVPGAGGRHLLPRRVARGEARDSPRGNLRSGPGLRRARGSGGGHEEEPASGGRDRAAARPGHRATAEGRRACGPTGSSPSRPRRASPTSFSTSTGATSTPSTATAPSGSPPSTPATPRTRST